MHQITTLHRNNAYAFECVCVCVCTKLLLQFRFKLLFLASPIQKPVGYDII